MHLLGIIIAILAFIFFLVLAFGMTVVGFVLRLLGWGNHQGVQRRRTTVHANPAAEAPKTKRFSEGEGEYIDFEEV